MKMFMVSILFLSLSFYCRAVPAQQKQHELAEEEGLIIVKSLLKNEIARQEANEITDSSGNYEPGKCGDPPLVENGYSSVKVVGVVALVASYQCNEGYSLHGSSVVTCDKPDKGWNNSTLPNCTIVDCGKPSEPSDGSVKYLATTYDSVAKYGCEIGYNLIGDMNVSCQKDGKWSGSAKCEIISCKTPPTIIGGSFEVPSIVFGSTTIYQCDKGHTMVGNAQITCKDGMEWSGPAPTCKVIDCGAPPKIEDGTIVAPSTTYNSVATYKCNPGCIQIGDQTELTCELDGKWNGSPPKCLNPIEWTGDKFDKWYPQLIDVDFYKVSLNELIRPIYNLSYEIMMLEGMKDHVACIDIMHILLAIPEVIANQRKVLLLEDMEQVLGTYILRNPVLLKDARALQFKLPEIIEKMYEPIAKAIENVQKILDNNIAGISLKHFQRNIEAYFIGMMESGKPVKAKEFVLYILKIVTEVEKIIDIHLKQTHILLDCSSVAMKLREPIYSMKKEVVNALQPDKIAEMVQQVTNLEPAVCEMVVNPFVKEIKQQNVVNHFLSSFKLLEILYNLMITTNANPLLNHWSVLDYILAHPFSEIIKTFRAMEKLWPIQADIYASGTTFGSPLHKISEDLILKLSSAVYPSWRYHNGKPENECERRRDSISVFLGTLELKRFNYSLDGGMFAEYSDEFLSSIMKKYPTLDSRLKEKVKCRVDKILAELYIYKMSKLVTKIKHDIDTRPYEKLSFNMATMISRHRPKDLGTLLVHIARILDIYVEGSSMMCNISSNLVEELHKIVSSWDDVTPAISKMIEVKTSEVLDKACIHDDDGFICIEVDENLKAAFAKSLQQLMFKVAMHLKKALLEQLEADDLEILERFIAKDIALSIHHEVKKIEEAVARVPIL